jgi:hypothetical protein
MRMAYIEDAATFVPNGEIGRRYGAPRFEVASACISCHTNLIVWRSKGSVRDIDCIRSSQDHAKEDLTFRPSASKT